MKGVASQPGLDIGNTSLYPFIPEKTQPLSDAILLEDGLTFEAHSTSTVALTDLVKTHFFFLKVGPELTLRFRETVWALAASEEQLGLDQPSHIRAVMMDQMNANSGYWQDYHSGTELELQILRVFSYRDRNSYYWADKKTAAALNRLINAPKTKPAPDALISQAFMGLEFGEMSSCPNALIAQQVQRCVSRHFEAAGHRAQSNS